MGNDGTGYEPGPTVADGYQAAKTASAESGKHEAFCITADGRNLHDEGYCDVTGQDYNEWRG